MKQLLFFSLILFLFSCGKSEDGERGPSGDDGHDGTTPEPIPPLTPLPPIPGTPGSDSIMDKRFCKLSWPLTGEPAGRSYEAIYNVLFYKEGVNLASLSVTYKTINGSLLDESKSLLTAAGDDPKAHVEMGLWVGNLSSDKSSFELMKKSNKEVRSAKCL